jgi:hypothetical protein
MCSLRCAACIAIREALRAWSPAELITDEPWITRRPASLCEALRAGMTRIGENVHD